MQEFLSDFTQMWALKYVRSFVVTRIRLVKLCCVRLYTVAHVVQNKNHNTSPAEAVARSIVMSTSVCLSVCLSDRISWEPHGRSLPIFLCMMPMTLAQSSSGRMTKSQWEGAILGIFPPTFTMHCNAFAAHNVMQQQKGGDGNAQREMWSMIALLRLKLADWFNGAHNLGYTVRFE